MSKTTRIVIIVFTLLAGMVSIVSIDLFNGIVMTGAIILAVPFALDAAGGWTEVTTTLPADHFQVFGDRNWLWAVGVFFPTFFLLLGESSIYQKFFSAESESAARKAVIGMILGVVIPRISQMFIDAGAELPLATRVVVAGGEMVNDYWWVAVVLVALVYALFRYKADDPRWRIYHEVISRTYRGGDDRLGVPSVLARGNVDMKLVKDPAAAVARGSMPPEAVGGWWPSNGTRRRGAAPGRARQPWRSSPGSPWPGMRSAWPFSMPAGMVMLTGEVFGTAPRPLHLVQGVSIFSPCPSQVGHAVRTWKKP